MLARFLLLEYLSDPENIPEEWDEPILVDGQHHARRQCRQMAQRYTEQSRSSVELVDVLKASTQTRKRYLCRFRSEIEP